MEDAGAVQALASDPAIAATTTIPSPYPPDGAREFIHRSIAQRGEGTDFVFAVVAGDRLVGACALHGVTGTPPRAELGYWIGRPYWGRGYASSATRQIVRWAFGELAADLLTAQCLEHNRASRRVLEKLGFRVRHRAPNTNPKWLPEDVLLRYELSRTEWRRGPDREG